MIISKLKGGLGNQLFQYAIGRRFAIDGQTDLKIDIGFFDHQSNATQRDFKLQAFRIDASIATEQDKEAVLGRSFFQPVKRRLWKMGIDIFHWNYLRETTYGYHSEVFKFKGSVYLDGYWQCPLYFESIRTQLLQEISIKNNLQTNDFIQKVEEMKDKNSIAVHIRRGDYVTNPIVNHQFGVCPIDYFKRAIHFFRQEVLNAEFYVFSDDIEWCKANFKAENDIQFVSGFADYEDLALISSCKHQIISNSTFSWWGAWLNQNFSKIVIAPKVWYIDSNLDTSLLIPAEWKRL